MIGMDSDHCRTVRESLAGERTVDERTFASLAILTERLERLKGLGEGFSKVTFSPAAKELARHKSTVAIG